MRIGLLITSIGNFGQKGFYNAQEIGLARALDAFFDEVKVYKLVSKGQMNTTEKIEDCRNTTLQITPSKHIGINGLFDTAVLDRTLDILVYFTDTQIAVPKVYQWADKNKVQLLPYIGVIESHSTSRIKKKVMNLLFRRNLNVYRKCLCLVKTPAMKKKLQKKGISNPIIAPVGLDISLLYSEYRNHSVDMLKKKYGYQPYEKIVLFIGRMTEEKQPDRMISIFNEVAKSDNRYRLLMIGTGEQKASVQEQVQAFGITDKVKMIDRIPNAEIWELYRIADTFVNLNQQEIFGMAILEAMYYECKVVAWNAPGPNFIIENGISGWLADSNEAILEKILDRTEVSQAAHERVVKSFTWEHTAKIIAEIAGKQI